MFMTVITVSAGRNGFLIRKELWILYFLTHVAFSSPHFRFVIRVLLARICQKIHNSSSKSMLSLLLSESLSFFWATLVVWFRNRHFSTILVQTFHLVPPCGSHLWFCMKYLNNYLIYYHEIGADIHIPSGLTALALMILLFPLAPSSGHYLNMFEFWFKGKYQSK